MLLCNAIVTVRPISLVHVRNYKKQFYSNVQHCERFYFRLRQKSHDLLHQVKALHQSPEIELKNIDIIWRKVTFPQLLLKADRNELVSVPETLKRRRPLRLSPHKPPFLSAAAFASRLHWLVDFSTASPTVSRLRPGFVVWLIPWKDSPAFRSP